jgi:nucleoside-diphosphate-sugar epimerase
MRAKEAAMKKILLLGGTGAMGVYLVPALAKRGCEVSVTSRASRASGETKFILGDAQNTSFLKQTLNDGSYDCVVDFMNYSTAHFKERASFLLENSSKYVFLSSYRVFAGCDAPITESSPRLLDACDDAQYLKTDEYGLAKARQENILRASPKKNWTIVRPAITFSLNRFQLCTLEANMLLFRAFAGLPVALPSEMLAKKAAITWAGDVADMIASIALEPASAGEDFNVCSSESQSWNDVAEVYKREIGLQITETSLDKYIWAVGGKYQVMYDRMFNRVMDNSKILKLMGTSQESLTPPLEGLSQELRKLGGKMPPTLKPNYAAHARMDKLTSVKTPLNGISLRNRLEYFSGTHPVAALPLRACKKALNIAKSKGLGVAN